jgi:hypothetical protein
MFFNTKNQFINKFLYFFIFLFNATERQSVQKNHSFQSQKPTASIFGKYREFFDAMEKKMKKRIVAFLYGLFCCLFIWFNIR